MNWPPGKWGAAPGQEPMDRPVLLAAPCLCLSLGLLRAGQLRRSFLGHPLLMGHSFVRVWRSGQAGLVLVLTLGSCSSSGRCWHRCAPINIGPTWFPAAQSPLHAVTGRATELSPGGAVQSGCSHDPSCATHTGEPCWDTHCVVTPLLSKSHGLPRGCPGGPLELNVRGWAGFLENLGRFYNIGFLSAMETFFMFVKIALILLILNSIE